MIARPSSAPPAGWGRRSFVNLYLILLLIFFLKLDLPIVSLIKCEECGSEMSDNARSCPKCGSTQPKRKGQESLLGCGCLVILVSVIGLISSVATMCSQAKKIPSQDASHTPVKYKPAQLKEMIASGRYPLQGKPKVEEKEMEDFSTCVLAIEALISAVEPYYPTEVIVDLPTARIHKFWTNDSSVMIACSEPDGKYVMTTAPYVDKL